MSAPTTTATRQASGVGRDRLWCRLKALTGCNITEVRVTPVQYGAEQVWCAMALDSARREVPLPGITSQVAALIRTAFPDVDWVRAHDYDVTTGMLVEHSAAIPGCLLGDAL